MQIITDLQIHSKYSRATSPRQNLPEISLWASKKGIDVIATGDWTHPLWFREIQSQLKEVSPGLFTLKETLPEQKRDVYFLLSTEISSIYTQGGATRRVHNLIFSPSIETSSKIISQLQKQGCNLMADGRPIIGLSSINLLELVLSIDPNCLFIPAHAWTPWFSIFGSKSGFNSIKECFGELHKHIFAIESGLSSDPAMNWQIDELDSRSILSFSDAHSGPKLGREATVFIPTTKQSNNEIINYSYRDIADAIKQKTDGLLKIAYTIEFFPEEGKYHYTGHRDCGIKYSTIESKQKGTICPKCGKQLTVGVEDRVTELANRTITQGDLLLSENSQGLVFVSDKAKTRKPFVSIVPLLEILAEIDASPTKNLALYENLVSNLGSEFDILLKKPLTEIEKYGSEKLKKAIEIVRKRQVKIDPGYDGVFGKVKVFDESTKEHDETQSALF
ncbi:hypothetical protein A3C23_04125 [Candidatus Roizmanbacteria bacterium RIFCSPHIGHO2_02_FULL_37_13b]|uniref:DNA helicase UvrD n=1 Tax=Candidatus Roizmanbacteria bacterium RIFCSPLOWO2_02_FULL_36_11 TaxID=1802071 RepID=A0A1F7JH44_9BACT|nr:MAG: hypothetical protein A3C23_04125 [Candidatus Roizmanbacteria bacterium RIFCSPHIGHO2_02_FULL_37_13b]OGK54902.1 MAG: hypothetical protein A3H78_00270 [Candidatus Roizmanbacteria bacterium RIFCSPLOWO2_02_FULL_36_11]